MRYSIITPTLVRSSLRRLCDSIDAQTNSSWEHIIMVDVPLIINRAKKEFLEAMPQDSRRKVFRCGKPHKDYGNTCRWNAFEKASGDYVIYLDDDDYLADEWVFETLEQVTAQWAIFPIMRCGERWFHDPPGLYKTGSGMFIYKRDLGLRYPCEGNCEEHQEILAQLKKAHQHDSMHEHLYAADGMLVEKLKQYPYQSLDNERPLMIYEKRGKGLE
jgi:glycosyltransferase involved in cell wall biosynthesis